MLCSHVRYFSHFNLFTQLVVSWFDPFYFVVKNLKLLLLLLDIILGIVDAEMVWIDARFDFWNLVELLRHCISHVQLTIQLRKICIQRFEDSWFGILRWLGLNDEFLESFEAGIIEFVLTSIVKNATESFGFNKVRLMDVLVEFRSRISFVYNHNDDIKQWLFRLW